MVTNDTSWSIRNMLLYVLQQIPLMATERIIIINYTPRTHRKTTNNNAHKVEQLFRQRATDAIPIRIRGALITERL